MYAYSFQGGGWNQNVQLDLVRALVEQQRFEISSYASNTGDVSRFEGRVYSNKPPGLPLLVSPVYALLYWGERWLDLVPGSPSMVSANAYVLSVFASAMPGVGTVLWLVVWFPREGASEREALLAAAGFGAGTLVWPYSGLLMSHNLVAFLLFGGFMLITAPQPGLRRLALGGGLLGWAVATDGLALPAALVCAIVAARLPATAGARAGFFGAAGAVGLILAAHNTVLFGEPFAGNRTQLDERFVDPELLLGTLGWPDPARLYWLTLHPFRGLLYCCPVFLVPVLGRIGGRTRNTPPPEARHRWARVAIPSLYLLFNLSFNGWAGGWSVGPRYLIPALPFVFSFALAGYRRFPRLSSALTGLSVVIMLSVSLVQLQIPSPNHGRPTDLDPVRETFTRLSRGEVSVTRQHVLEYAPGPIEWNPSDRWDAWNWGERVGLQGAASALPVAALSGLLFLLAASGGRSRSGAGAAG